ncbi:MAG: R.Pab1 family restriction endonuclease, partial [Kiritimatiellota bacterium]|nr:R.Pab1 family restriction endonuclease [Kiritimatiellota bacterium]
YAVGTQAMLYFCFPITELQANPALLGRTAQPKETAKFVFNKDNFRIIPKMIRIFGMLSKSHQFDILAIIELIQRKI